MEQMVDQTIGDSEGDRSLVLPVRGVLEVQKLARTYAATMSKWMGKDQREVTGAFREG